MAHRSRANEPIKRGPAKALGFFPHQPAAILVTAHVVDPHATAVSGCGPGSKKPTPARATNADSLVH